MLSYFLYNAKTRSLRETSDPREFEAWFADIPNRIIARDQVGDYRVSTVCLGLNHNFGESGDPLVFETMIFKGSSYVDEYCDRYSSVDAAEAGHATAVKIAKLMSLKPPFIKKLVQRLLRLLGREVY